MILNSTATNREVAEARRERRLISDDAAQTIASWWYGPREPALVQLAQRGHVAAGLADEVRAALRNAHGVDREDLAALLAWVEANR